MKKEERKKCIANVIEHRYGGEIGRCRGEGEGGLGWLAVHRCTPEKGCREVWWFRGCTVQGATGATRRSVRDREPYIGARMG